MPVRLKDIAQDLGVSTITVSKVLRGNPDIGPETRKRVLKRVRELNYQPNMLARGLASGRTYTMGLVVPDLVHPFFAELAKSLAATLRVNNNVLILASSEEDPEIEREEIQALSQRGVDVLLLASCSDIQHKPALQNLSRPCLLLDRNFPKLKASFVGSNDVRAGELATEHLLEIGRKRIAHIGGKHTSPSIDRAEGFRNALAQRRVSVPKDYVVVRDRVEESGDRVGFQAMEQLLRLPKRPDAVFCYNDITAIGAIDAVLRAGLRVPEDVAIVGCGNLRYAAYLQVPLTSVDQQTAEFGRIAGETALALAASPDQPVKKIVIEPTLQIRRSSVA